MVKGRKKTREAIQNLLKGDQNSQMPLFEVSDQPMRDTIFIEKSDTEDTQQKKLRKLFDNDKK